MRTEREPDGAGDGARQVHEREARAALRVPDEAVARVPDDPLGGGREVLQKCQCASSRVRKLSLKTRHENKKPDTRAAPRANCDRCARCPSG